MIPISDAHRFFTADTADLNLKNESNPGEPTSLLPPDGNLGQLGKRATFPVKGTAGQRNTRQAESIYPPHADRPPLSNAHDTWNVKGPDGKVETIHNPADELRQALPSVQWCAPDATCADRQELPNIVDKLFRYAKDNPTLPDADQKVLAEIFRSCKNPDHSLTTRTIGKQAGVADSTAAAAIRKSLNAVVNVKVCDTYSFLKALRTFDKKQARAAQDKIATILKKYLGRDGASMKKSGGVNSFVPRLRLDVQPRQFKQITILGGQHGDWNRFRADIYAHCKIACTEEMLSPFLSAPQSEEATRAMLEAYYGQRKREEVRLQARSDAHPALSSGPALCGGSSRHYDHYEPINLQAMGIHDNQQDETIAQQIKQQSVGFLGATDMRRLHESLVDYNPQPLHESADGLNPSVHGDNGGEDLRVTLVKDWHNGKVVVTLGDPGKDFRNQASVLMPGERDVTMDKGASYFQPPNKQIKTEANPDGRPNPSQASVKPGPISDASRNGRQTGVLDTRTNPFWDGEDRHSERREAGSMRVRRSREAPRGRLPDAFNADSPEDVDDVCTIRMDRNQSIEVKNPQRSMEKILHNLQNLTQTQQQLPNILGAMFVVLRMEEILSDEDRKIIAVILARCGNELTEETAPGHVRRAFVARHASDLIRGAVTRCLKLAYPDWSAEELFETLDSVVERELYARGEGIADVRSQDHAFGNASDHLGDAFVREQSRTGVSPAFPQQNQGPDRGQRARFKVETVENTIGVENSEHGQRNRDHKVDNDLRQARWHSEIDDHSAVWQKPAKENYSQAPYSPDTLWTLHALALAQAQAQFTAMRAFFPMADGAGQGNGLQANLDKLERPVRGRLLETNEPLIMKHRDGSLESIFNPADNMRNALYFRLGGGQEGNGVNPHELPDVMDLLFTYAKIPQASPVQKRILAGIFRNCSKGSYVLSTDDIGYLGNVGMEEGCRALNQSLKAVNADRKWRATSFLQGLRTFDANGAEETPRRMIRKWLEKYLDSNDGTRKTEWMKRVFPRLRLQPQEHVFQSLSDMGVTDVAWTRFRADISDCYCRNVTWKMLRSFLSTPQTREEMRTMLGEEDGL